jgi:hypothetical protein
LSIEHIIELHRTEKKKHTRKISEEKSYYLQTQTAVPSVLGAEAEEKVELRACNSASSLRLKK